MTQDDVALKPRIAGGQLKKAKAIISSHHKKLKESAKIAEERRAAQLLQREKRKDSIIRPSRVWRSACIEREDIVNMLKVAKDIPASRLKYPNRKLILVIRNNRKTAVGSIQKLLKEQRLNAAYTGILLENDLGNQKILKLLKPFIIYCYPDRHMIESLLEKRGTLIESGQIISPKQLTTVFGEQIVNLKALTSLLIQNPSENLVHLGSFIMDDFKKISGAAYFKARFDCGYKDPSTIIF